MIAARDRPDRPPTPHDIPRTLSSGVTTELEAALRSYDSTPGAKARIARALEGAAADARALGLRAEELIVAFKALEARILHDRRNAAIPDGGRKAAISDRTGLIEALLDAYYRT